MRNRKPPKDNIAAFIYFMALMAGVLAFMLAQLIRQ